MSAEINTKHKVTVVIPVYDDWTTLEKCLKSLKKYLGPDNKVLLVNDMGPNWEMLENRIKEEISGRDNFIYEKNLSNLGFVKTCNRAVFELDKSGNDILLLNSDTEVTEGFLDEMLHVLYVVDTHGVVCPRSNCATIYTLPFYVRDTFDVTPMNSYEVYKCIKEKLPRFSVMPTGVGFAMLIRRELIDEYGLFDEIYSPGYNEENDFCMRINKHGYSCVAANRAYVYHFESKSFGGKRDRLDMLHSKYLLQRYPHYPELVERYMNYRIDPVEYFADLITGIYDKKSILLDLSEGTRNPDELRFAEHFCDRFLRLFGDKYNISVFTDADDDRSYSVHERYDMAFSLFPVSKASHLQFLNRTSLRYVIYIDDICFIRDNRNITDNNECWDIYGQSLQYADGIIFANECSRNDLMAYFNRIFGEKDMPSKTLIVPKAKRIKDDIIDNVAGEIERSLETIILSELNVAGLYGRWRRIMYDAEIHKNNSSITKNVMHVLKKRLRKHPGIYNALKKMKR